jgi:hypothetical protein
VSTPLGLSAFPEEWFDHNDRTTFITNGLADSLNTSFKYW